MEHKLMEIVNVVRKNKGVDPVLVLNEETDLRTDLGFDSLDLAELTVRIERETGVDIFADGFVQTIADIYAKLR